MGVRGERTTVRGRTLPGPDRKRQRADGTHGDERHRARPGAHGSGGARARRREPGARAQEILHALPRLLSVLSEPRANPAQAQGVRGLPARSLQALMPRPNWFFAFPLDGSFVESLSQLPAGFRRYHPDDVHLTLTFLGGCGEEAALRALAVLDRVLPLAFAQPIDVALAEIAPMGPRGR